MKTQKDGLRKNRYILKKVEGILSGEINIGKWGDKEKELLVSGLIAQNEELVKTQNESEEANRKFQILYKSSAVGYLSFDPDFNIKEVNHTAQKLLGRSRSELLNKSFANFIPDSFHNRFRKYHLDILKAKAKRICKLSLKGKDGEIASVLQSIPMLNDKKKVVGIVSTINNLSETPNDELKLQTRLIKSTFEKIPEALIIITPKKDNSGNVTHFSFKYINEAGSNLLKLKRKEIIGRTFNIEFQGVNQGDLFNECLKVLESGKPGTKKNITIKSVDKKGINNKIFDLTINKLIDSIQLSFYDVTEQKIREEALIKSVEKYRDTFENIPIGAYATTPDGKILMANPTLVEMLGYESSDDLAKRNLEVEGYENLNYTREKFKELLESKGELRGFENAWRKRHGEIIYVRENARVVRKGNDYYYEGTVEDITEKKLAEEARLKSELLTKSIINSLSAHVAVLNKNGFIIEVNKAWDDFAARNKSSISEWKGINYLDVFKRAADTDEAAAKAFEGITAVLNGIKEEFSLEYPAEFKSEKSWFLMNVKPLPGEGVTISHVNITEGKLAGEVIRQKQLLMQTIINTLPVGVSVADKDGNIFLSNEEELRIWGIRKNSIYEENKEVNIIFPGSKEEITVDKRASVRALNGEHVLNNELCIEGKNGNTITILNSAVPIFNEFEEIDGVVKISVDITDLKKNEQRLNQIMQELERSNKELEQFAYVASHDLREPLRMITNFTKLLANKYKDKTGEAANEFIGYILEASERMSLLIKDILKIARVSKTSESFERTDLNLVLENILADLKMTIDENRAVIKSDPLPEVIASPIQMRQLFQNLVENAIKFKGNMSPLINISVKKEGKEWLFIVSDNGIGIEQDQYERIFLIFQRLHERDKYPGTGIGLALCRKIVEQHGGSIWVKSEINKGTSFYFTIPIR